MKRHSAVIFPETVPDEQILVPLVLVFQPLVYCQPVERKTGDDEEVSSFCNELLQHVLCRRIFPAPLGPDRDRFLSLLSDLRHRGGEYTAQMAHVSLAALGPDGRKKVETKSSIVSNLLKGHGIESERRDRKSMLLWQARLVLKLGEFMDVDQRALAQEVQAVTEREKGLFSALRDDPEGTFSMTERLASVRSEGNPMQRLLLKAWARIFALGSSAPLQERVFITRSSDAVDHLAEEYERTSGVRPAEIISLLLPARMTGSESTVEALGRFTGEAGYLLEELYAMLSGALPKNDPQKKFAAQGEGSWGAMIENYFPADVCGRCQLTLYNFGPVSPRHIFLDSFGFDEDMLQQEPVKRAESEVIIGVLSQVSGDS